AQVLAERARALALESDDRFQVREGSATLESSSESALDEDGLILAVKDQGGGRVVVRLDGFEQELELEKLAAGPVPPLHPEKAWLSLRLDPPPLGGDRFEQSWAPRDWTRGDWCYVRVQRSDGELAWSSPVWVE